MAHDQMTPFSDCWEILVSFYRNLLHFVLFLCNFFSFLGDTYDILLESKIASRVHLHDVTEILFLEYFNFGFKF